MLLRQIFDPLLRNTLYPVGCQRSGEALINDPERDIDRYRELAAENGLRITAVAETHIHADFVSGGREFAHDPDVNRRTSMRRSFQRSWRQGYSDSRCERRSESFRRSVR